MIIMIMVVIVIMVMIVVVVVVVTMSNQGSDTLNRRNRAAGKDRAMEPRNQPRVFLEVARLKNIGRRGKMSGVKSGGGNRQQAPRLQRLNR